MIEQVGLGGAKENDLFALCADLPAGWAIRDGEPLDLGERQGSTEREILTLDCGRLSAVLWQSCRSLLAGVEALEAKLAQ